MQGIAEPLRLADASFDGSSYTFTVTEQQRWTPKWGVREEALPAGYTSYVAVGDTVTAQSDFYVVTTSPEAPNAFVTIYNFAPLDAQDTVTTITIHKAECPAGYGGDNLFADCHDDRVAGVTFEWLVLAPGAPKVVTTDGNGVAVIETSGAALGLQIVEEPPYALADYVVYCSVDDGAEIVPFNYLDAEVGIIFHADTLTAGEDVICDWYNIPVASDSNDDDTGPTDDGPEEITVLPSTGAGPGVGTSQGASLLALALLAAGGALLGVRRRFVCSPSHRALEGRGTTRL
jgi:hypothetical protein